MSLVKAEIRRFFARRFTLVMLAVIAALFALIATATALNSHQPTAADHLRAQQQLAVELQQNQQMIAQCEYEQLHPTPDSQFGKLPPGRTCADFIWTPTEDAFLGPVWTFATDVRDTLYFYAGIIALFGFAIGASFVGAEWSSGGLANLLLWRPRRTVTLGAKLGALLVCQLAVSVVVLAAWIGTMCLVAATRGRFGQVTGGLAQSLALTSARSIALGLAAAAIGFAVASLGRRTAAALGAGIAYLIVVEVGGRLLFEGLRVPRPDRFMLSNYIASWLTKHTEYGGSCDDLGNCGNGWVMTMGNAAELIGIVTAIFLGLAFYAFSRRDVT
jgi:ABC-2 type transport system permease protein